MIPGIWAIVRVIRASRTRATAPNVGGSTAAPGRVATEAA
jgi:hypothetical protein